MDWLECNFKGWRHEIAALSTLVTESPHAAQVSGVLFNDMKSAPARPPPSHPKDPDHIG